MNTTLLLRIMWKEYRQQRALWLAVLAFCVALQLAVLGGLWIEGSTAAYHDRAAMLFSLALAVPVLHLLGCSAILFAGEHENETFAFQQALPVSSGQCFAGKMLFAAGSAAAMMPAAWLIAWALAGGALPAPEYHAMAWLGSGLACLEVLMWGSLFSLLIRRVLPAAGTAGAAAALAVAAAIAVAGWMDPLRQNEFLATVPLRFLVVVAVGAVVVYLGRHCLDDEVFHPRRAGRRVRSAVRLRPLNSLQVRLQAVGRLMWQEVRQSWPALITSAIVGLLVVSSVPLGTVERRSIDPFSLLLPAGFVAALLGGCTLYQDKQGGRFRFFAERGISARRVWMSRLGIWGLMLLVLMGVMALRLHTAGQSDSWEAASLATAVLFAFVIGQAAAIFTRSGIVGIVLAVTVALLGVIWTAIVTWLAVPLAIAVVPLLVGGLFAAWLYAPDWIEERVTWWVRTRTFASLAIPLAGVWLATSLYRGYEVPIVSLPFDVSEVTHGDTPAARETGRMYREAWALLKGAHASRADSPELSPDGQRGLELFRSAAERPTCRLTPVRSFDVGIDVRQLAQGVLEEAHRLDAAQEWDRALELRFAVLQFVRHLYQEPWLILQLQGLAVEESVGQSLAEWAWQPGQDAARVRSALTRLEEWQRATRPRLDLGLAGGERETLLRMVNLAPEVWQEYLGDNAGVVRGFRILSWLLPWEQQRSRRVIDAFTSEQVVALHHAERALLTDRPGGVLAAGGVSQPSEQVQRWVRTTPVAYIMPAVNWHGALTSNEMHRRATRVRLALIAWRWEEGELPQQLEELVGHGLGSVPVDPFTGRYFLYEREGVPIFEPELGPLGAGMASMGATEGMAPEPLGDPRIIGREPPFLWSPGPQVRFQPADGDASGSPQVSDFRSNGQQLSPADLQRQGVMFPLAPPNPDQASDAPESGGSASPEQSVLPGGDR